MAEREALIAMGVGYLLLQGYVGFLRVRDIENIRKHSRLNKPEELINEYDSASRRTLGAALYYFNLPGRYLGYLISLHRMRNER